MKKKLSIAMLSAAVTLGVCTAFATNVQSLCEGSPQYYKVGSNYFPAGQFGLNYYCASDIGYCTYYRPSPLTHPGWYLPCRFGAYTPIF